MCPGGIPPFHNLPSTLKLGRDEVLSLCRLLLGAGWGWWTGHRPAAPGLCSCVFPNIHFMEDMEGQLGSIPQSPEWRGDRGGVPSLLLSPGSAGWEWSAGL